MANFEREAIWLGGAPEIADILGTLAIAILFRSIYHLASRSFYAQQDTRTPLYISIITILLNIFLAATFVLALHMGVFGLAAAQAIVAVVEVAILFTIMSWRIRNLFNAKFVNSVLRMVAATALMFVVTYLMIKTFNLTSVGSSMFALLPPFILIVGVSLTSYLIFSRIFNLEEATPVLYRLKQFALNRVRPVQ